MHSYSSNFNIGIGIIAAAAASYFVYKLITSEDYS